MIIVGFIQWVCRCSLRVIMTVREVMLLVDESYCMIWSAVAENAGRCCLVMQVFAAL